MEVLSQSRIDISTPKNDQVDVYLKTAGIEAVGFDKISADEPTKETKPIKREDIDFSKLVHEVSQFVESVTTKVSFSYDERTNKPVIMVTDKETGDLIRQIPEKDMLDLLSKLEYIAGVIYHSQV